MRTIYSDLNLQFSVDNVSIQLLSIMFERFLRTIPSHSHGSGCYEIHYIPFGYGKLKVQGNYYDIIPNTLYVTGPHVEHAQTPIPDDPMQEYCIYIKINKSVRAKAPALLKSFMAEPFWFGQDSQELHVLIKHLFWELENQRTGYQEQIKTLLSQIFIGIIRNYEQRKKPAHGRLQNAQVDNKSMIIEEYFLYEYKSLSLDELAGRLFLSPRQTQRLLLEYYGKTFQEKKAQARMSAAAILLGDKTNSISAISEALGYSSPEQFSTAFKKFYGMSPRDYRKTL